jgi:hypothetical protein
VAVHADGPALAAEVAVGLLDLQQVEQALADRLGVLAVLVGVARTEISQQRQAGQGGVGLPVVAGAVANIAGRAVDGVVVLAGDRDVVRIAADGGVPTAVGVLVAGEPG